MKHTILFAWCSIQMQGDLEDFYYIGIISVLVWTLERQGWLLSLRSCCSLTGHEALSFSFLALARVLFVSGCLDCCPFSSSSLSDCYCMLVVIFLTRIWLDNTHFWFELVLHLNHSWVVAFSHQICHKCQFGFILHLKLIWFYIWFQYLRSTSPNQVRSSDFIHLNIT